MLIELLWLALSVIVLACGLAAIGIAGAINSTGFYLDDDGRPSRWKQ